MKRILSVVLLFALLASSCSEDELIKNQSASVNSLKFSASIEGNESRTYIEKGKLLRWTAGDQISLFVANTLNRQYQFEGKTGDNSGTFSIIDSPFGTGNTLNCHYAVYPYAKDITITDDTDETIRITATLPAEQCYAENSFGTGANTMVAVTQSTDDTFLNFKNVCGYLKLQFYGEDVTIKSITLTGNNEEKIAGKATIIPAYGEDPSVSMTDDATEAIVFNCGESGVKIGATAEEATAFWMVIPPTTFENGFSITVTDVDGKFFEKITTNEILIARNTIQPMKALEVVCEDVVFDTLLLPDGRTFNSTVGNFLSNHTNLTKIKFVANSNITSESVLVTDEDGTKGYLVANGEWLEIHTSSKKFVADKYCDTMFNGEKENSSFRTLQTIDFGDNFDTSQVTNMSWMFAYCENLVSLDLSNFDTSNVTYMYAMFSDCKNLTSLDVTNLNTSNVEYMSQMFHACSSLTSLDVSGFDTSKVKSMYWMFAYCTNLTSLDVSSFDTSNVMDLSNIFYACVKLTSLDLSNFDTSNVTDMSWMFCSCESLASLDLSSFDTSKVTDMENLFANCMNLTSLDVSNFDTSNVTNMDDMFCGCSSLTSLDVSDFDTSKVTNMSNMFTNCSGLVSLDLSNFVTSNVTDMAHMFSGCEILTSLDIRNFDTSNVTNMRWMFTSCLNLTSLDVSNFETSNVTDMSFMFSCCEKLTSLDVSKFETSNVTNMSSMFSCCEKLTSLDVSKFETSNVTDMSGMFTTCRSLTSLDLSNFNTSKVTDMNRMFPECENLTSLDLSTFDTSNVTNMDWMFGFCGKLTSLDLTNFSFAKVASVINMLKEVGADTNSKPIPVKVTNDGYIYLTETTTDCAIGTSAKFVKPDGTEW